jgi:hypothetical protein
MDDSGQPLDFMLSVIIVSYNTRDLTLRCLTDLYADLKGMAAEVFVVDNGSSDDSVAMISQTFPAVVLIESATNRGFGPANNLAMARAVGEFILLLNSDAFVRPGAVAALIDYLRTHPSTVVVGPRLLNADGSLQRSCYRFPGPFRAICEHLLLTAAFPRNSLVGDYRRWEHDADRVVDFVIGACVLLRREAVEQVGMFDEAFFMYAEETDLCRRLKDRGWTVAFTPSAQVVHLNGGSGKAQSDRVFNEFGRGGERYIRKHHGVVGLAVFRVAMIFGSLVRITMFGALALLPGRRERAMALVRKWVRILTWNLGHRGEGLVRANRTSEFGSKLHLAPTP